MKIICHSFPCIFFVLLVMCCDNESSFSPQYAIRAFADALDAVPMALAENSGLQPIETLNAVKSQQIKVNGACGLNLF